MKKIILFVIVSLLALLITSCNIHEAENNIYSSVVDDIESIETENDTAVTYDSYIMYMSPEECVNYATDIIKGKCINVIKNGTDTEYEFEVIERFIGDEEVKRLVVHNDTYVSEGVQYEKNTEYYLMLTKRSNVYKDYYNYGDFSGMIYIPSADIQNSTFYGDPLIEHTEAESLSTEKEFVDYLKSLIDKRDPELERGIGLEYIKETDMKSIISKSDYVLRVKIEELSRENTYSTSYYCRVISALKGDVKEDERVKILFFANTVSIGEEYILALTDIGGAYVFSSKNSLFSVDDLDEIQKYLNN